MYRHEAVAFWVKFLHLSPAGLHGFFWLCLLSPSIQYSFLRLILFCPINRPRQFLYSPVVFTAYRGNPTSAVFEEGDSEMWPSINTLSFKQAAGLQHFMCLDVCSTLSTLRSDLRVFRDKEVVGVLASWGCREPAWMELVTFLSGFDQQMDYDIKWGWR